LVSGLEYAVAPNDPQFPALWQIEELTVDISPVIDMDANRVARMGMVHLPTPGLIVSKRIRTGSQPLVRPEQDGPFDCFLGTQTVRGKPQQNYASARQLGPGSPCQGATGWVNILLDKG
jgi:hypothetical protein